MPGFESISDQNQPIRILTSLFQNGAVPHALLFTGIDGVGKRTCATAFAMLCNCLEKRYITEDQGLFDFSELTDDYLINPCGNCRSCRKIESANHPDIILIKPVGAFIRIEQIRNLCDIIVMKPYEAKMRVVIISDAQRMTQEAGNALLKSLEEPPERTIFILTANQISDLIPTIVSRCRHIRFKPIPLTSITEMLVAKLLLDPENSKVIASLANGSFAKALKIGANKKINRVNHRKWLLKVIATNCFTGEALYNVVEPYGLIFALSDKLSRNKELLFESLEIIKTWLRDIAVYKYSPDKVVNIDMIKNIKSVSEKVSIKSITSKVNAIHKAQKNIQANANLRTTIDVLMLRLAGA
ncbi:MAG: DNA polymerase III subunit delta' [Desulfosarcina sp.]|nr:DNA polymerase III subunit delta' [Desulfobacterales bacterium]